MIQLTFSLSTSPISSSPWLATSDHMSKTHNILSTSLKTSHPSHLMPSWSQLMSHEEGIAVVIHFIEEYKQLLSTNCRPPHIVRIILSFILTHSTYKFMDTHMHQILDTSMGIRMAPPYANLFMGNEERTIILNFLHLIYFWKRFIDDIFFIFLGSHSQLNSLMTFMNTISPTIKYTFTYSEEPATFLDVQIYLYKNRKLKTKLYRKSTDCMTLLHFHSHHPISCKEGIIYS